MNEIVRADSDVMRAFRAGWIEGNRAWNEGDFERAYTALPDDFEYHLAATWPQARPLHGRAEVVALFEDFRETFPDVRSGPRPLELLVVDERTAIVGFEVKGTGRTSGASIAMEIWQVWEFSPEQIPSRLIEFHDRESAFAAAGAAPPQEAGA